MIWVDYSIEQVGEHFRVRGEYDGEVIGKNRDGTDKDYALYKPGDIFIVDEDGWLRKVDKLTEMCYSYKHENT